MIFLPRDYQHKIIDSILFNKRVGVWAQMGLGKSVSVLTALSYLSVVEYSPTLIIAPKRVAISTWPDEVEKWDHLKHFSIVPAVGSLDERKAALRSGADIVTINYDNLPWLVDYFGNQWPFKIVVADESTRLKSFRTRQGGKRAAMLGRVAHTKVKRFIELTGTPTAQGLQDLWGQAWFLDKGQRLGLTYKSFEDRWFRSIQVGSNFNARSLEPLAHAEDEIIERLSDICFAYKARDYLDVKEPITTNIYVDLPANARKLYQKMERELWMQIESKEVIAANAAVKTGKLLQLSNGAVYIDEKGLWSGVHDEKLEALDSIINEASGMPVLVSYEFKSDLARLKKAFPKGRELDDKNETIRQWNAGKIPVLFAHPASAGHGLNLQDGGNILVFFGHTWSLENRLQIIERIGPARQLASGYDRPVFIYNILSRDTLDEAVVARVDSRKSILEVVMERLKA